jgi:hypothetical protein
MTLHRRTCPVSVDCYIDEIVVVGTAIPADVGLAELISASVERGLACVDDRVRLPGMPGTGWPTAQEVVLDETSDPLDAIGQAIARLSQL